MPNVWNTLQCQRRWPRNIGCQVMDSAVTPIKGFLPSSSMDVSVVRSIRCFKCFLSTFQEFDISILLFLFINTDFNLWMIVKKKISMDLRLREFGLTVSSKDSECEEVGCSNGWGVNLNFKISQKCQFYIYYIHIPQATSRCALVHRKLLCIPLWLPPLPIPVTYTSSYSSVWSLNFLFYPLSLLVSCLQR